LQDHRASKATTGLPGGSVPASFALRPRVVLALVAITAFTIRLLHVFSYESIPSNDMAAFVHVATQKLTLANIFRPESFSRYAPGYLFFLKPFYILLSPESAARAVQIVQALLGAWTCVLVYRLARRLHSRRAGLVAAFLTCFFPHYLFFTSHWMTENLFIPVFYASLLWFLRLAERPRGLAHFGAGALMGAAILVRPPGAALAPAALFAAWKAASTARGRLRAGLLVAAGAGALLLPYSIHTRVATGHTWSIAPYGPYLMSIGNDAGATGTTRTIATPPGDMWEQLDSYRDNVIDFVISDPWGELYVVVKLKWQEFWAFDSPWPISSINPMGMWGDFFFPYASWRAVFIAGLVGMLLARKRGVRGTVFLVLACYVLFYMILYGKPRYRMPIEGVFLAFAGAAAAGIADAFGRTRRIKAPAWAAAIAVALALILVETGAAAAATRGAERREELVLARRDQFPLVAGTPRFQMFGDDEIPIDRARGRYLRLTFNVWRSGPERITPQNGFLEFRFADAGGSEVTWVDTPRYVMEALPADRWVPVRLKTQIPPAATSVRIEVIPDASSPDTFLVDQATLRYSSGNDLALEFLVPYFQRDE